jgi:septum formation protein
MRLVLASASPARLATLRAAGLDPEVIVSGVDESAITAPDTQSLVMRLAVAKAQSVGAGLQGDALVPDALAPDALAPDALAPDALVLGCDSMLELGGEMLGKPSSPADAVAFWHRLRGRSGVLYTGHALVVVPGGPPSTLTEVAATTVHFADVADDELAAYVASGEPLAVAGAFTIDGLGGWFVDSIGGDHHNVVGLSLPVLRRMVRKLGLSLTDLGWPATR